MGECNEMLLSSCKQQQQQKQQWRCFRVLPLLLLLFAAGSWLLPTAASSSAESAKLLMDKMMSNYTRQSSPNGDYPTNVYIGIYIIGFYSISEATMDYALTIYLRLQWIDPRLQFDSEKLNGKTKIKLEDRIWEKIWVPDVFLRNEKKADFHSVTIPNRFMTLEYNGQVWYVIKLSITLSCAMGLHKYPLDTQKCPMMFESFGHTMDTVVFKWLQAPKVPVQLSEGLQMPQFKIKKIHLSSCDQNYTTGAYPCLQIDFELKRDFGFFLIQIYIPTVLIVILSWFAFWLNIDAVPARVSLGLLTVLTITTQASSAKSSLPKVSYIKAIDVWMSVCLGFVFASLLEFAIVNVYSRRDTNRRPKRQRKRLQKRRGLRLSSSSNHGSPVFRRQLDVLQHEPELQQDTMLMLEEAPKETTQPATSPPLPSIAKRIDRFSRRFFPLMFLLFNVVYWVYYVIIA